MTILRPRQATVKQFRMWSILIALSGGDGWRVFVHNIRGTGTGAYTPSPDTSFPELLHRTR